MPVRKRSMPIDRRISRSRIAESGDDPKELLEQQRAMQRPPLSPQPAPASQRVELQDEPGPSQVVAEEGAVNRVHLDDGPVYSPNEASTPAAETESSVREKRLSVEIPPKDTKAPEEDSSSPSAHGAHTPRLNRQRPVSREDRPLSETESTLSRSGSGENTRLRGPRGPMGKPRSGFRAKSGECGMTSLV
jgi:hypothetical protein